jgi:hypothetical protein
MVRNLHLPNGERQTWANSIQKKPKRHDCMQRNCCCNEKIAELRNLLTYPWVELKKKLSVSGIISNRSDKTNFSDNTCCRSIYRSFILSGNLFEMQNI